MVRSSRNLILAILLTTSSLAGCGGETRRELEVKTEPGGGPPAAGPSLEEAAGVTIEGIYDHPVTLDNGRWEGRPFAPGGASRPSVELVPDFLVEGNLDGDATPEALVLLSERSGGSGTFGYLAVLAKRDGQAVNLGTASIGDRVQVRQARILAGRIRLDVVQHGPDDAACCPSQKTSRIWELGSDGLTEIGSKVTGTLSLTDLQGPEWVLTHLDRQAVADLDGELTIIFEDGRIVGSAGCNRYFAPVSQGQLTGEVEIGEVASTRKECSPGAMEFEQRFLRAVGGAVRYSFLAGKLALSYQEDNVFGVLLFAPRPRTPEDRG